MTPPECEKCGVKLHQSGALWVCLNLLCPRRDQPIVVPEVVQWEELPGEVLRYFSTNADCQIEFHPTAEQAKAAAEEELQYEADQAPDGWRDGVDNICWGEIRQMTVKTKSKPDESGKFDTIDDYELVDVGKKNG